MKKQAASIKLGELVRAAREAEGWTTRDAAQRLGMDASYLPRIERGERIPSDEYLRAIARVFKLDYDELHLLAAKAQPLPELGPYLRTKYDLPPEAVEELATHFERVRSQLKPRRKRGTS